MVGRSGAHGCGSLGRRGGTVRAALQRAVAAGLWTSCALCGGARAWLALLSAEPAVFSAASASGLVTLGGVAGFDFIGLERGLFVRLRTVATRLGRSLEVVALLMHAGIWLRRSLFVGLATF